MADSEKPTADREELVAALPHFDWCEHPHRDDTFDTCLIARRQIADALFASGVIQPANLHAAKVLRDAADEIEQTLVIGRATLGMPTQDWLRARADRIEGEEQR